MKLQNEYDMAQIEAEAVVKEMYEEWLRSFLGPRADVIEENIDAIRRGSGPAQEAAPGQPY